MSWTVIAIIAAAAWIGGAAFVVMLVVAAGRADRRAAAQDGTAQDGMVQGDLGDPRVAHGVAAGLLDTLRAHDAATARHSGRVARLARTVGVALGLDGGELDDLVVAAVLHDVGKLRVPGSMLRKPAPLSDDEWAVVRCHPEWGAEIAALRPPLHRVARVVRAHHERIDGTGYPDAARGAGVPLAARIIAVCDAFDAMTSQRAYLEPLSRPAGLRELERCAGSQFDPEVVAALCTVLDPDRAPRHLRELLDGPPRRFARAP